MKILKLLIVLIILCQISYAQRTISVFNDILFYDGYAATVATPAPPAGIIRHRNDLYARKLTNAELNSIGDSLQMKVSIKAACDNYDRIGNVNIAFVPKDSNSYNPNYVARIEVGRFITPFMDKNKSPNIVTYSYQVNNIASILKDSLILSQFDIWMELEVFGVPYAANTQIAGCSGRKDVFYGSLQLITSGDSAQQQDNVVIPLSMKKNLNNYNINATDTLSKTTRRVRFQLPVDIENATFFYITSNHGAGTNGEEYVRRKHYIYVNDTLRTTYIPGRTTCEPFRQYNTQANGIYGSTVKSDAQWQSFSNWCPGDKIDIRVINMGNLAAGNHDFMIRVPDAVFSGSDGYFPFSVYLQGKKSSNSVTVTPIIPPVHDEPCNAISLGATASCNYTLSSNNNATSTPAVLTPICGGYQGKDVWFRVTVPFGGALKIQLQSGTMTEAGLAAYTGACNSLSPIACSESSGPGMMPNLHLTGLGANSSLWLRVWDKNGNNPGTFSICALVPPPTNDEPCNAIGLNVEGSCGFINYSNLAATASSSFPNPPCANYQGGEVWFKTAVPQNGFIKLDTKAGTSFKNGGMAVYTGKCDSLVLVACDDSSGEGDMPMITLEDYEGEDSIWIAVWQYGGTATGTFSICLSGKSVINDEPCSADILTTEKSCFYTLTSNRYSTPSANPPSGCGDYFGKDVWYRVRVTDNKSLKITTQSDTLVDAGMAVYRGTCSNLQLITCDESSTGDKMPTITLDSVITGEDLWIRIWQQDNGPSGTFKICVTSGGDAQSGKPVFGPNPADNQVFVYPTDDCEIRIVDLKGNVIYNRKHAAGIVRINTSAFASGVFILQLRSGSVSESAKLIIAH